MAQQEIWEQEIEALQREVQAMKVSATLAQDSNEFLTAAHMFALEQLIGVTYLNHAHFKRAYDHCEKAFRIVVSTIPQLEYMTGPLIVGIAKAYVLGNLQSPKSISYEAVAELLSQTGHKSMLAHLYMQILLFADSQSDRVGNRARVAELMIDPGQQAIQLWNELGNELNAAVTMRLLANALDAPWERLQLLERAVDILGDLVAAEKNAGERNTINTLRTHYNETLANWSFGFGLYEQAVGHYERVKLSREASGDAAGLVAVYISLANCSVQMQKLEEATNYYNDAQSIATRLNDWSSLAQIHKGLSLVYRMRRKFELADKQLEQSIAALEHLEAGSGVLAMWMDTAKTYEENHALERAIRCYGMANNMARSLGLKDICMQVEFRMGTIELERRDRDQALAHFRAARSLAEGLGDTKVILMVDTYLNSLDKPGTSVPRD